MKSSLTKIIQVVALLAAGVTGGVTFAADADSVMTQAKRQDAVDKLKKLLAPREMQILAPDPFHSAAFTETVTGMASPRTTTTTTTTTTSGGGETPVRTPVSNAPRTDRDLVIALATSLKSPNVMVLNNQPVLLFGQKRVKQGDSLTINFEGNQYTVEIISIERPNFTLRYNREEYTRPITISNK